MEDERTGKRDVKVNAFKVPEEWYEAVKVIARERNSTISSAIIRLAELGIPLYRKLKDNERLVIAETVANYPVKDPPRQKKAGGS